MKKKNHLRAYGLASGALALFLALPGLGHTAQQAPQSSTAPIDESNPQTAILAAEERFKQAEKEFTAAENAEARAALGAHENSFMAPATAAPLREATPPPLREQTAKKAPERPKPKQAPREDVQFGTGPEYMGSPQTGYSATWKEPGSGDVMTSVIAPSEPVQTTPVYPMIIEPLVNGSDWSGQNNSWPSGNNWPGGYPGGSGINPPPPPNHNYRPLRPNNPSIWHPGMGPNFGPDGRPPQAMWPGWGPGGQNPPNPGMPPDHGFRPPSQGFPPQRPGTPPSANWRPGQGAFQPGSRPPHPGPSGWQGGMPATMRPLPMTPPGSAWGRPGPAPMGGRPHGGF